MNKIIAARLETRNFEFVAYATDTLTAAMLLKKSFESHIESADGSLTWNEVIDSVWYEEIVLNTVTIR